MKVKVGMKVAGDVDTGIVVAMSKDWCIYQPRNGEECAEPWESIVVLHEGAETTVSSITEKEAKP